MKLLHFSSIKEPDLECLALRFLHPWAELVDCIVSIVTFTMIYSNLSLLCARSLAIRRVRVKLSRQTTT